MKTTHNKKNVVLMFLIVMLSFAIVSEVSAISLEDAEPDESGLDVIIHSTDSKIHSERLIEVSHEPVEYANDISHSDNNQTLKDVYNQTYGNENLYEQSPTFNEDQKTFNPGEPMKNLPDLIIDDKIHFETAKIDSLSFDSNVSHLVNDVTSKLLGLYNVSKSPKFKEYCDGLSQVMLNSSAEFHVG